MRLFFGVTVSPLVALVLFMIAIALMMAPLALVDALTEHLPAYLHAFLVISISFVAWPWLLTTLYKRRYSSRGSAGYIGVLYWFYLIIFAAFAVITWLRVFTRPGVLENLFGALVLTIVASYMIYHAYQSRQLLQRNIDAAYAAEREDQINRHAEAILRAEEIKKQRAAPSE